MSDLNTLAIEPASRQTLRDSVQQSIRSAILGGKLRPGQRIPEARLAAKLGVSRGPVREALASLLGEGLVRKDARGVVVARLSRADLDEISSMRLILERLAVQLVVAKGTEEDFARLADSIARTARARKRGEGSEHDLEYHEILARAARHKRLLDAWLALRSQIRLLLLQVDQDDPLFPEHTAQAHTDLLRALRARDEPAAVAAIEDQITSTHRRVAQQYDKTREARSANREGGDTGKRSSA